VNPVVWKLGFTSLLTDISSEMVNSLLPVYLVLHLHVSTFHYGAIDGIYNGIALAFLGLTGGLMADRTRRPKEVAAFGYALSAACKLLLLATGAAWGWIAAVIALDRTGKGVRTAPRDAIITLCNPSYSLASAFAVHRALDAGGALLGPIIAFALLSQLPGAFDAVWLTSFAFAFIGLAVLWLFVENPANSPTSTPSTLSWRGISAALGGRGFWSLAAVGLLLSATTLSDGFLYLLLQRRSNLTLGFFPLFYVVTACFYMLLAVPIGRTADRYGRLPVFVVGYLAIGVIYVLLLSSNVSGVSGCLVCLFLLGLHYAATQGILIAMASDLIPAEYRASGLAVLATLVGFGKFISSALFGWLWQTFGATIAIQVLAFGLAVIVLFSLYWLRNSRHAKLAQ
jgi:MFS family permease